MAKNNKIILGLLIVLISLFVIIPNTDTYINYNLSNKAGRYSIENGVIFQVKPKYQDGYMKIKLYSQNATIDFYSDWQYVFKDTDSLCRIIFLDKDGFPIYTADVCKSEVVIDTTDKTLMAVTRFKIDKADVKQIHTIQFSAVKALTYKE